MLGLQRNYVRVNCSGKLSYGGSQMWSPNETLRICGCGPEFITPEFTPILLKQRL